MIMHLSRLEFTGHGEITTAKNTDAGQVDSKTKFGEYFASANHSDFRIFARLLNTNFDIRIFGCSDIRYSVSVRLLGKQTMGMVGRYESCGACSLVK